MNTRNTGPLRQVYRGLAALLGTIVVGIVGYMALEGWGLLDAVYMTVITISTTGFREVHALSPAGKVLTLVLIISGVGSIAYTGGKAVQLIVEAGILRSRRMNKRIAELQNHFVVCGFDRMGRYICDELRDLKEPFVVVEKDAEKVDQLRNEAHLYILGDATHDEVLLQAGVMLARGMACVLATDAENVFATLSVKALNPALFVVARAAEEDAESKLLKAGANRVVKPYETGGTRIAELLVRPGVLEFIDIVARDRNVDLAIEAIEVGGNSSLAGRTLAEAPLRQDLNAIIVSIGKPDGKFLFNPRSTAVIEGGDRLFALGDEASLSALRTLAGHMGPPRGISPS